MRECLRALVTASAVLSSCSEPVASGDPSGVPGQADGGISTSTEEAQFRLTSQPVNAIVKRTALRLIHLETAHERFVTTPEHPFATRDAGWVRAGALRPGDLLISGRHGAIAVSSIRSEVLAQPVSVFNLTVDRTHSYLVGSDQVLVHNVGCKPDQDPPPHTLDDAGLERELRETEGQLNTWRQTAAVSTRPFVQEQIERLTHRADALRAEQNLRREGQRWTEEIRRIIELRLALANNLRRQRIARTGPRVPGIGEKRKRETPAEPGTSSGTRHGAQPIADLERKRAALLVKLAELRARQLYRKELRNSGWMQGTKQEGLTPAHLVELRSEIARGGLSSQRLAEIERELARSEPITPDYLRALWQADRQAGLVRQAEIAQQIAKQMAEVERELNETTQADLQTARDEAADVDDLLMELEDLIERSPSPEPDPGAQLRDGHDRVWQELHEERGAVEAALRAMAREQSQIERTQAGSSTGPTWEERLRALQQEQVELRADWRRRMMARIDNARRRLETIRSAEVLRDPELELMLELELTIELLESELQRGV